MACCSLGLKAADDALTGGALIGALCGSGWWHGTVTVQLAHPFVTSACLAHVPNVEITQVCADLSLCTLLL
jgi:hypothetical protein